MFFCGDTSELEIGDFADMGRNSAAPVRRDPKTLA